MKNNLKVTGLIVEYNPLHYGHLHHLKMARTDHENQIIIAAMSGNFVQRGEPAILRKKERVKMAIQSGIDIVLEIPTIHVLQRADIFAQSAIHTLKLVGVDEIVYGIEANSKEPEKRKRIIDLKKQSMAANYFPFRKKPNQMLAHFYEKTAMELGIDTRSIRRIDNYHSHKTHYQYASASAIRQLMKKNKKVSEHSPMNYNLKEIHTIEDYYKLIQMKIIQKKPHELNKYFLMDEGIENLFKKNINHDFTEFIRKTTSKRYTKSRIQRTLMHLLLENKDKDYPLSKQARILGFNQKGQNYLRTIKKNHSFTSDLKKYDYGKEELQYSQIYALIKQTSYQNKVLYEELTFPLIEK